MTPAKLIEARNLLGLNITEMADRLNTPRGTYLKWERGDRRVPPCFDVLIPLVLEKDGCEHTAPTSPLDFLVRPVCDSCSGTKLNIFGKKCIFCRPTADSLFDGSDAHLIEDDYA